MRRIGIVSDSHYISGQALPPLEKSFAGVDLILHAGDVGNPAILEWLRKIAPVECVAGNCDGNYLHLGWPRRKLVQADGMQIGLIHGDGVLGSTKERARRAFLADKVAAVVFGHSHQAFSEREEDGVLLFNPGSLLYPRFGAHNKSCGILTLDQGRVMGEIIYFTE